MNTCKRALEGRTLVRTNEWAKEDSDSTDTEEETSENETLKQVSTINEIAVKIIMQTRRQYLEGIQMNEFYPLVWEDFTNKDALTENYECYQRV